MVAARPAAIVVQKYGGSSLATPEALQAVARGIVARRKAGHLMVVVVSAMGRTTEGLLAQGRALAPSPPRRELDMLVTAGERICMALLCIAIDAAGGDAISLTGSQSGIITDTEHQVARILEVNPWRIHAALARGQVCVVAGYQGVSRDREITTLGRGGSDTSAVALAAALDAEVCEIYSDVDGVFDADPNVVPQARLLSHIRYAPMQTLADAGARVLNAEAVAFAKQAGITIIARRTGGAAGRQTRIDAGQRHFLRPPLRPMAVAHLAYVSWAAGPWQAQASFVMPTLTALNVRIIATERGGLWLDRTHMADRDGPILAARLKDLGLEVAAYGSASLIGEASMTDWLVRGVEVLRRANITPVAIVTPTHALSFVVPRDVLSAAVQALHSLLDGHAGSEV